MYKNSEWKKGFTKIKIIGSEQFDIIMENSGLLGSDSDYDSVIYADSTLNMGREDIVLLEKYAVGKMPVFFAEHLIDEKIADLFLKNNGIFITSKLEDDYREYCDEKSGIINKDTICVVLDYSCGEKRMSNILYELSCFAEKNPIYISDIYPVVFAGGLMIEPALYPIEFYIGLITGFLRKNSERYIAIGFSGCYGNFYSLLIGRVLGLTHYFVYGTSPDKKQAAGDCVKYFTGNKNAVVCCKDESMGV